MNPSCNTKCAETQNRSRYSVPPYINKVLSVESNKVLKICTRFFYAQIRFIKYKERKMSNLLMNICFFSWNMNKILHRSMLITKLKQSMKKISFTHKTDIFA